MKLPIHCSTVQSQVGELVILDLQLFGNYCTHFYVLYKLSFQVRLVFLFFLFLFYFFS